MIESPSFLALQEIVDVRSAFVDVSIYRISKEQNVEVEVTHFMFLALVRVLESSTQYIELSLIFNILLHF